MLFSNKMLAFTALFLPILATAAPAAPTSQPRVELLAFTAPGCVAATQVGPIDVSAKVFASNSDACVPTPNGMTAGLVQYTSYRTYFPGTPPASTFCTTTIYSDSNCQTRVNSAPVKQRDGNDCNNAIPIATTDVTAVGIKSFKVICGSV